MILSSKRQIRERLSCIRAIALSAMALSACSDNREQVRKEHAQEVASREAVQKETNLYASPDAAISELRKQISDKVFRKDGGFYPKNFGILPQNYFISRNSAWRVQCGPFGFSVIFQPSSNESSDLELKLTWVSFSQALCDATVPAIGAHIASLTGQAN